MTKNKSVKFIASFLFLLLAGRVYQFLFLEPPLRAFLLDTGLMKPFIEGVLGIEWFEYVTNRVYEARVNMILTSLGVLLVLAMLSTVFYWQKFVKKILPAIMIVASIVLLITSIGYYWDKSTQMGQFWEYSLQFGLPIIFILLLKDKDKSAFVLAKIFTSLTFIAHGLYAVGFYPVPGEFVHMTSRLLGITDDPAKTFLYVAGIIDFVFGVAIWIPKIQKPALVYGLLWGFATAFARLIGFYYHQLALISLHQSFFEMLVRLPHGAVPLWILLKSLTQSERQSIQNFLSKFKIKYQNNEISKTI